MSTSKRQNFFIILILGFLTALSPFSIDMYLPAFPQIANDLQTSVARVSLSLSSYFVGLAAGQLIYGPLLDRFGRKRPLYVGLVIYILACIGCLFSHSIETLMFFRLLQALGGCAAGVGTMAMVRDRFSVKESAKVLSLLMLILGTSPLIAPTFGSFVSTHMGWHAVFIFLGLIGLSLLTVVFFFLPESHKPDPDFSLRIGPIIENFISILKTPQFYVYAFTGATAFSGLFVYVAGSPILFMDTYKVSAQVYGWIFASLAAGFISAGQVNVILLKRFRNEHIMTTALLIQACVALVFTVGTMLTGGYALPGAIVLLFLYLACLGFIGPNTTALALAPFSRNAGSAAAVLGFLQMGFGALASLIIGLLTAGDSRPIIALFSVASLTGLSILLLGRKRIRHQVAAKNSDANLAH